MDIEAIRILRDKFRQLEFEKSMRIKGGIESLGVSLSQSRLLLEIGRRETVSIVELAEILGLDASTLSRNINGLVNKGMVDRVLNPSDRRYVSVSLSGKGRNLYQLIDNLQNRYFADLFEGIPEEKRRQAVDSVVLMAEAFQKIKASDISSVTEKKIEKRRDFNIEMD